MSLLLLLYCYSTTTLAARTAKTIPPTPARRRTTRTAIHTLLKWLAPGTALVVSPSLALVLIVVAVLPPVLAGLVAALVVSRET